MARKKKTDTKDPMIEEFLKAFMPLYRQAEAMKAVTDQEAWREEYRAKMAEFNRRRKVLAHELTVAATALEENGFGEEEVKRYRETSKQVFALVLQERQHDLIAIDPVRSKVVECQKLVEHFRRALRDRAMATPMLPDDGLAKLDDMLNEKFDRFEWDEDWGTIEEAVYASAADMRTIEGGLGGEQAGGFVVRDERGSPGATGAAEGDGLTDEEVERMAAEEEEDHRRGREMVEQ